MKPAYTYLARVYDVCMDADYERWVEYLMALFAFYQHDPGQVLDIGCGTGNIAIPLAQRGLDLTGVDLSAEMVAEAEKKAVRLGLSTLFLVQDLLDLELCGKVFDTVLSTCDVLNYLTEEAQLKRAFGRVYDHLRPGGLWFFDLNSAYKLQNIYGDEFYADLQTDFAYFWNNSYAWDRDICTMVLTFFIKTADDRYERVREKHQQKLWMPQQIEELAKRTGFDVPACWDFFSKAAWSDDSERWQFVLRKTE